MPQLPPEIIFHRFFQTRAPVDRRAFRGRVDVDGVGPESSLLLGLQAVFNESLAAAPRTDHDDPFHFDYIDSDTENAVAFHCEGYRFIGLTLPLIRRLWAICGRIARTDLFSKSGRDGESESIQIALFRTHLSFIVGHEFTHHVHGHVDALSGHVYWEHTEESAREALRQQVLEADADGFAVYLVLHNILDSDQRSLLLDLLGIESQAPKEQDRGLMACFIASACGHLLTRRLSTIDATNVYSFQHPPPAARMNLLMHHAMMFVVQFKSHLQGWMTQARFQSIIGIVSKAAWGDEGSAAWAEQTAFFRSEAGDLYTKRLIALISEYKQSRRDA